MSASLVGSEMCIRDSRGDTHHGRARTRWLARLRCKGGRPGRGTARPSLCLLYTSDAADDM
eukprot:7533895-Alexandrium_andersonii.AAC.1